MGRSSLAIEFKLPRFIGIENRERGAAIVPQR
jgi:hypothetical protein